MKLVTSPGASRSRLDLKKIGRMLNEQKYLMLMSFPFVIWVIVFRYVPLWGWTMAFQDFKPGRTFFEQKWVGLKHFETLLSDPKFYEVMKNTLGMSFLGLLFGFTLPIILALLLNEISNQYFKRIIQTVSYLPHFLSWVIVASLFFRILSPNGTINEMLMSLGLINEPIQYLTKPQYFWFVATFTEIWKNIGWNSIIFLAAISGVNPELYESAVVDGAGRFRKMLSVTLPSIMPTVIVILIMTLGNLINIGFEKQLLLRTPMTKQVADVLDLYVLDTGIGTGRYSLGTAAGIFKSVVSLTLLFIVNKISKKTTDVKVV